MIPVGVISSQCQVPQVSTAFYGYAGNYKVHKYTYDNWFMLEKGIGSGTTGLPIDYLVVAGGGGGGAPADRTGGGGGGGGMVTGSTVTAGSRVQYVAAWNVDIGAGGRGNAAPSTSGGNSLLFGSIQAIGGGHGGHYATTINVAESGGSGGGAYHSALDAGAAGTSGQGNAGGDGYDSGNPNIGFRGGGGGGKGSAGTTATSSTPGHGGAGGTSDITGTTTYYAAGGGGGSEIYTTQALGGSSIGGNGAVVLADSGLHPATDPAVATGSGGGGGARWNPLPGEGNYEGTNGAGGVIFIRYLSWE